MEDNTPNVALPDRVFVTTEAGIQQLEPVGMVWEGGGVTVALPYVARGLAVQIYAPNTAVRRLHLHWRYPVSEGAVFLGDHFERGYGDLEWRGLVPERLYPWYFLAHNPATRQTTCFGVATGANALCWWRIDGSGHSLYLSVANGGGGVMLGERTLTAAVVHAHETQGLTAIEAAYEFCRILCPTPRLPNHVVYGSNNWYYAYGSSSHEEILRDADILMAHAPNGDNPPYMVVDDCWQANRLAKDWITGQQGPWRSGNDNFPDMPGLAAAIQERGARPGIWIRPLGAEPGTPENRLLSVERITDAGAKVPALDPSIPENRAKIVEDMRCLRGWGYTLIKHDWTTCDILGRWGFQMLDGEVTRPGWHFADRSRTTAEIIRDLYAALREGAGDAVLIGCNTIGHLGAGVFELQRTGDDTSGQDWTRTRKMGINTLAFRMPQHDTFFAVDADCVGLTTNVPWHHNAQWLDLLARSGTPLFVSTAPDALGAEQSAALKRAFAVAAQPLPPAEPLDWLHTTCPRRWRFGDEEVTYDWYD